MAVVAACFIAGARAMAFLVDCKLLYYSCSEGQRLSKRQGQCELRHGARHGMPALPCGSAAWRGVHAAPLAHRAPATHQRQWSEMCTRSSKQSVPGAPLLAPTCQSGALGFQRAAAPCVRLHALWDSPAWHAML